MAVVLILSVTALKAQPVINIDSIKSRLSMEQTDTLALNNYYKILKNLAKDNANLAAVELIGNWIIANSNTPEKQKTLAATYNTLGRFYLSSLKYEQSARYLYKGLEIVEKNNFYIEAFAIFNALANLNWATGSPGKIQFYLNRALLTAEQNNYQRGIAIAKFQMATFIEGGDSLSSNIDTLKQVIKLKREAFAISKQIKDTETVINCLIGIAESFSDYKFFDSAISTIKSARSFTDEYHDKYLVLGVYFIAGKIYNARGNLTKNKNDFLEAINYTTQCLNYAKDQNDFFWIYTCYDWLADDYLGIEDYKRAYDFSQQYRHLHDSLIKAENFKNVNDIQNKYEHIKKDKEISELNISNNQKSFLNKALIGATAALMIIIFLGYRNFKHKQKLEQQKIAELEKEKKLLAVEAMLKGQEEERNRLAKDLHDGLGGMLSGVKISFSNMKENIIMDAAQAATFEKSISQLDDTIAELRKVAHNLMPEALVKFGLKNAVKDFCESMQLQANTKIICEQLGEERELGNIGDVNVYRIIQELVNNAVIHGEAKQIVVQLTKTPNKVLITVEDNGKGFDLSAQEKSTGIGLSNIKHRVNYFSGKMDIDSKPAEGTVVNIEITA